MALPPTIYRVSIQLADLDRNCYEQLQFTVARHPSETAERLVARLLAYALCQEEGLAFTKGIGAGDEPDLWAKGPDGRVRLWVEVGLPDPERLLRAVRHAEQVALFACGGNRWRWEKEHLSRLIGIANLTVYGLAGDFLQQIADQLQRAIAWSLTVTEGNLYLTVGETTLEAPLTVLAAAEPGR
ncbi:MAG: YaeQ family protein [Desulfuromonadales bacterium]|jgi:uncharacterized protein YaeQ